MPSPEKEVFRADENDSADAQRETAMLSICDGGIWNRDTNAAKICTVERTRPGFDDPRGRDKAWEKLACVGTVLYRRTKNLASGKRVSVSAR